jgi:ABC-type methionine transport system permease subunit
MIGLSHIYLIIIVLTVFSVIGLAIYKVIKSKLPDMLKVFWIIAFIVLNILAAIPFIIFHDYILTKEKRAN